MKICTEYLLWSPPSFRFTMLSAAQKGGSSICCKWRLIAPNCDGPLTKTMTPCGVPWYLWISDQILSGIFSDLVAKELTCRHVQKSIAILQRTDSLLKSLKFLFTCGWIKHKLLIQCELWTQCLKPNKCRNGLKYLPKAFLSVKGKKCTLQFYTTRK